MIVLKLTNKIIFLFLCISFLTLQAEEKQQLYIGVESNRMPYSYLDKNQQANGILIKRVKKLCAAIDIQCTFIHGSFDELLEALQTLQINSVILIDSFVNPQFDNVSLSLQLCQIQPIFIQKNSNPLRSQISDFRNSSIGVLEASIFHLYLLDEYSSHTRLKSYPIQESAIVDLITERIDALFTEQAFFEARIANTILAKKDIEESLTTVELKNVQLSTNNMRLLVRKNDLELLNTFNQAIQDFKEIPSCANLI